MTSPWQQAALEVSRAIDRQTEAIEKQTEAIELFRKTLLGQGGDFLEYVSNWIVPPAGDIATALERLATAEELIALIRQIPTRELAANGLVGVVQKRLDYIRDITKRIEIPPGDEGDEKDEASE